MYFEQKFLLHLQFVVQWRIISNWPLCTAPSEKVFRDGKFLQRRLSIDLLGCWPGKKVLCINRVNEEELGADKKMGKLK